MFVIFERLSRAGRAQEPISAPSAMVKSFLSQQQSRKGCSAIEFCPAARLQARKRSFYKIARGLFIGRVIVRDCSEDLHVFISFAHVIAHSPSDKSIIAQAGNDL